MGLELKVYDNGDHTCLVWLPTDGKAIPNCRGFSIRRLCRTPPATAPQDSRLHGFVGYSDTEKLDPGNPCSFPLQRYMWWDYSVRPGDVVQYSVTPVTGPNKDHLKLADNLASALTPEMTVGGQCTPHISAYFNKGIVASQWVSRALSKQAKNSKIKDIVAQPGNELRNALSGLLRPEIVKLLTDAKQNNRDVYAALYELNDPDLIPALKALGKKCHLILANGAFKDNNPPENDENAAVRATLKSIVDLSDRIVKKGHFGHNKFVVICDAQGKAETVLTGSTNWTSSGLCTQANNAVIIKDPAVASDYLEYWKRIRAAKDGYPTSYVDANSTAKTHTVDGGKVTPWCVPTNKEQDLKYARELINGAKDGILFLFFNPGTFQQDPDKWTLLQNILFRHHEEDNPNFDGDLYFCGVVNQEIPLLTNASGPKRGEKPPNEAIDPTAAQPAPVTLFRNGIEPPMRLSHDVLVPHNIKTAFASWVPELLGASMVNIHSKVIVLDPFGDHPVVMTGSHNLGLKASSQNDDNLIIIEGNAPLAAAYAINIIAIFQTYRWNSYVEAHRKDPRVWHGLVDNDTWQTSYLQGDELQELKFWMGAHSKAPANRVAHASTTASGPRARKAAAAGRNSHK